MKKIAYKTPEIEVVKLNLQGNLLQLIVQSGEGQEFGGEGSPTDEP